MIAYTIIVLAAAERLGELIYAAHNTRALLAKGGVEIGRAHYPLFILLHTAWLVSIVLTLPLPAVVSWAALSAYLVLELLRVWTIGSLGPYWTTRIITLPNAPLVKRGPYLTPASILLALLIAEHLGRDKRSTSAPSAGFRLIPVLYIPLQLLIILWAARQTAQAGSVVAFVSLSLAVGVCTGVFGVLAAHEMVHSRAPWHQVLGTLLLAGMTYPHFRIAHVYGHHRLAATGRDPSTAKLGETFYSFLLRTLWAQWRVAWDFENRRCRGQPAALLHNSAVR